MYLWDTGGLETHGIHNITPTYFKNAHAVMLVYNPGVASTLRALTEWMKVIQDSLHHQKVVFSLWRNDTGSEVDIEEADEKEFLHQNKIPKRLYFRISTSLEETQENIRESFIRFVQLTHKEHRDTRPQATGNFGSIEVINLEGTELEHGSSHDHRRCNPC